LLPSMVLLSMANGGSSALLSITQSTTTTSTTTTRRSAAVSTIGSSNSGRPLMLGCVAYDPTMGEIWSGIQNYPVQSGIPFDYVLFTNYEAQIRALTQPGGGGIDMTWNGPVAHIRCEQLAQPPKLLPDNVGELAISFTVALAPARSLTYALSLALSFALALVSVVVSQPCQHHCLALSRVAAISCAAANRC
jgi:hypothetical protein